MAKLRDEAKSLCLFEAENLYDWDIIDPPSPEVFES